MKALSLATLYVRRMALPFACRGCFVNEDTAQPMWASEMLSAYTISGTSRLEALGCPIVANLPAGSLKLSRSHHISTMNSTLTSFLSLTHTAPPWLALVALLLEPFCPWS